MKTINLLLSVVLFFASTVSADNFFGFFNRNAVRGSGDIITVERDISEFTRLKSTGSFDIDIIVGEKASLKITYDDNLIELIDTENHGKTLEISSDRSFRSDYDCKIEVTVTDLKEVRLSGSGDIVITKVDTDFLELTLSGSGDIYAEGKADEVELSISGSGNIDTRDLIAHDAYVKVSGSGDIKLFADKMINARVTGSGDITYYGNPEDVSKSVTGSGSVRHKKR